MIAIVLGRQGQLARTRVDDSNSSTVHIIHVLHAGSSKKIKAEVEALNERNNNACIGMECITCILKLSPKVQGIFSFLKALHMELYPKVVPV
jgi:hypothetical protein